MPDLSRIPPARRPDLLLRPLGDDGQHVVKDLRTGAFFNLGPVESFLLLRLDGREQAGSILAAYEAHFGEALSSEDLNDFLEIVREWDFLVPDGPDPSRPAPGDLPIPGLPDAPRRGRQSLLFWRKTIFDPDRLFDRIEPRIRFIWTRTFLVASAGAIGFAGLLVWSERRALATQFPHALRWETLVIAWLTMVAVTTLHEFAHGLTCKHYGGEVHEIGFLLMYGLPCFFCNVSDAWLFREKSKRLWVTLAGGYCDLVLWALAVFVWRLTLQDSLPNYIAWVVLSICGVRIFFNCNPLLKLDGYYVLGDWLEIPNLRQRAWDMWMGHLRWALWGAPRPGHQPRGRFLLGFGMASWSYSLFLTVVVLLGLKGLLAGRGGVLGSGWLAVLGLAMVRGQFQGATGGEFAMMVRARRKRAACWAMGLMSLMIALVGWKIEERVGGDFQVRPSRRAEVRAPIAGFLRAVSWDEGEAVSPGSVVAQLEVPELESRIAQKRAEVEEAGARLRLLRVGPRPEEVAEQRARVRRAVAWCDLGRRDLERAEKAWREELRQLEEAASGARAEHEAAADTHARSLALGGRAAISAEQLREAEARWRVAGAGLKQAMARRSAREASGTVEAEAELALREQKLAEARSALALLEAGTRPEVLEAEQAHLARLQEEQQYLEGLRGRSRVSSPVGGLVATPRLREKLGQYLREGDLICEVEDAGSLEAEIGIAEQDVARVRVGQSAELKARALPFETFRACINRIATRATKGDKGDVQATLFVYCRPEGGASGLRPGMTGHARVACGRKPIVEILFHETLRLIRTEFWW